MIKIGNTSKDSKYLARIKTAIEMQLNHPRHHGVKMQAHHAISAKGMELSGFAKRIKEFGYDINLLSNLVFLPCTLQGACYLGVQPHRGNHTALWDQDEYDDDEHPRGYHDMVAQKIKRLELPISKECAGSGNIKEVKIQTKLDDLSKMIVDLIQKKPGKAPLTSVAKYFTPGDLVGCSGVDSITLHRGADSCSVSRNHYKNQASRQRSEDMQYKSNGRYTLEIGK